jgi:hypothetical protein
MIEHPGNIILALFGILFLSLSILLTLFLMWVFGGDSLNWGYASALGAGISALFTFWVFPWKYIGK